MNSEQRLHTCKFVTLAVLLGLLLALAGLTSIDIANAQTTLTVQILSWDKIGIDKLTPLYDAPNTTAVQARICNIGAATATNVTVNFTWNSSTNKDFIYLASQLEQKEKNLGTLEPGKCTDIFYIVGVQRSTTSIGKTRAFTLRVTSNQSTAITKSQLLTVVGLTDTNSLHSTIAGVSDYTPSQCTTFQVSVWDNVTESATKISFPVTFDPKVVEMVNVTVKSWNDKGVFLGTSYSLVSAFTGKTYHYVTYTFHALHYGNTGVKFIIQDLISVSYKYNSDYDLNIIVPINVTLYLGDYVWEDMDGDGIQDAGEPGIGGVTVRLRYYNNNTVFKTTTTNATGYYRFDDLYAANYTLQFVAPPNYHFTQYQRGTDSTRDSNANATGWTTKITTLYYGNNDVSWDAGLYRYASLGDYVWHDQNGNGIQDPGFPLGGETVTLYNSTKVAIKTTTTNDSGKYWFTGLTPGDYYVKFEQRSGFVFSPKDNGFDDAHDSDANKTGWTDRITLTSDEHDMTIDAGLFQRTALGSFVWEDLDANGIQDVGEPGIGNVTVNLYNDSGFSVLINTTRTYVDGNNTGYYGFGNLTPSRTYYIEFVLPNDSYVFSPEYQGTDYKNDSNANRTTGRTEAKTSTSGSVNLTIDAGMYRFASLGDYVWNDQNGNGIQDQGIIPLVGVTVILYNSTKVAINNTTTNEYGIYQFTNLTPGDYYVEFVPPTDFFFSPKDDRDTDDAHDSDANVTSGWTDLITLRSGEYNDTIDAGLHEGTAFGDFVWEDLNANGIQDVGEPGMGNVTVILYNEKHNPIASTSTYEGTYGFANLPPHKTYYIEFVLPNDSYVFSPQYQGTDYKNDSNANETGWTGAIITPISGLVNSTIDAGMWRPASLGDFVWTDSDCDGIQDAGESGVSNVTVHLYRGGGVLVSNTTTNSMGYYLFTKLKPGEYYLVFDLPCGYTWTLKDQGDDSSDSDVDQIFSGFTDTLILGYGETNLTLDAGLCRCYASLGGFVWLDCSGGYYDGIQSVNESLYAGVKDVNVTLNNSTGVIVNTTTTSSTGYYLFTNLTPEQYYLVFELPGGYHWTLQDQGTDDIIDSDVNASTNRTITITLNCCETDLTWDAGLWSGPCMPIPELDTVVLFSVGLLALAGYTGVQRRRSRK